jgi:hypothetical protein
MYDLIGEMGVNTLCLMIYIKPRDFTAIKDRVLFEPTIEM